MNGEGAGGEVHDAAPHDGFLPIETNWFDRLFIGVVVHVALNLLWMRFLEAVLPLWIATVLGVVFIVYTIRRG